MTRKDSKRVKRGRGKFSSRSHSSLPLPLPILRVRGLDSRRERWRGGDNDDNDVISICFLSGFCEIKQKKSDGGFKSRWDMCEGLFFFISSVVFLISQGNGTSDF